MIDSLLAMISHGTELSAAAGHTSQTAFAAVLCAALFNFLVINFTFFPISERALF